MKAFVTMVAVLAVMFLLLTSVTPALAKSGWGLEDPQLCVNGQLLTVTVDGQADVFVQVPKQAVFSNTPGDCGIASDAEVVPLDHVSVQGGNMMRVTAFADDGTLVIFAWGHQRQTDVAKGGDASAKFKTK